MNMGITWKEKKRWKPCFLAVFSLLSIAVAQDKVPTDEAEFVIEEAKGGMESQEPPAPQPVTISSEPRRSPDEGRLPPSASPDKVLILEGLTAWEAVKSICETVGLSLDDSALYPEERTVLMTKTNWYGVGLRMPWTQALAGILRDVNLRYYDDDQTIKIGNSKIIEALHARREQEILASNFSRISVTFSKTPVYQAVRTVRDLANFTLNLDFMANVEGFEPPALSGNEERASVKIPVRTTSFSTEGRFVEWRVVLREILDPHDWTFREEQGIVRIMTKQKAKEREEEEINSRELTTVFVKIHHANPDTLVNILKEMKITRHRDAKIEVTRGSKDFSKNYTPPQAGVSLGGGEKIGASTLASAFPKLERPRVPAMIMVRDVAENIDRIKEIIAQIDVPEKQILIEALILEVSDSFIREFGLKWPETIQLLGFKGQAGLDYADVVNRKKTYTRNRDAQRTISKPPVSGTVSSSQSDQDATDDRHRPQTSSGQVAPGRSITDTRTSRFEFFQQFGRGHFESISAIMGPLDIKLMLDLIEDRTDAKVLSCPSIVVGDGNEALIQVGEATPVPIIRRDWVGDNATLTESVEWQILMTGLSIWILPEISPDNRAVRISVHPQDTKPGETVKYSGMSYPSVSYNELNTRVSVPSGHTLLLGGLARSEEQHVIQQVPFLGSIPWIGRLFRRTTINPTKKHMVIMIRPTILDSENPQTEYERASLKVSERMLKGIGKDLDTSEWEDPIVEREKKARNFLFFWRRAKPEPLPPPEPSEP